jgi:2'-5' RNA ligase
MRLFAALDLDAPACDAIASGQASIRAAVDFELRWVQPAQLHLTLLFLGEIADSRVDAVVRSFQGSVPLPAFEIALAGLGVFPPRGAPKAVWIGVRENEPQLQALHGEVARRVREAGVGVDAEEGAYRPHLTLARFKRSRPADRHVILRQTVFERGIRQKIDHATLYQSELSSGPPRYVERARANLTST